MTLEQRIADVIRTEGPMTGDEIHARFDEFESRKQSAGLLGSMKRRGLLTLDKTTRRFALADEAGAVPAPGVGDDDASESVDCVAVLEAENARLRAVIEMLERDVREAVSRADPPDLFGILTALNDCLAGSGWWMSLGADGIRFETGHVALRPASQHDLETILAVTSTSIQFISEEART